MGNNTASGSTPVLTPVDVIGLSGAAIAATAGNYHSCAIIAGGGVKCWGSNAWGIMGNSGSLANYKTPVDGFGLSSGVANIHAGLFHTCIITSGGAMKCWGYNAYGQNGDGTTKNNYKPSDVVGLNAGVTAISVGYYHTCAIVTGGIKCWGFDDRGQLGIGNASTVASPIGIPGITSGGVDIEAGGNHSCALVSGGVKCWGYNPNGQIGNGTFENALSAYDVTGLSSGVISLSSSSNHACVITSSGGVSCWGYNFQGQIGNGSGGTNADTPLPKSASGIATGATSIAAGVNHTCAIVSGAVKCWGHNLYGQLGDGTTATKFTPISASGLAAGMTGITTGGSHSCALTSSGGVKCWGSNLYGQLGGGVYGTNSLVPVDVAGLSSGVVNIDAGDNHTCAVTASGALKCWGYNLYGQLGDGGTGSTMSPVSVVGLSSGVRQVSASSYFTCALMSAGGIKCWGNSNGYGQLGNGTTDSSYVPSDVLGISSAVNISSGYQHACATLADGSFKCWGSDHAYQLLRGINYSIPLDAVGF